MQEDLCAIIDRIDRRSGSPHPDQLLELFLIKILTLLDRKADAAKYMAPILNDYSPENGWFGRADTTTHAIAVLAALDRPPVNLRTLITTADRIVRTRCVRHAPGLASWGGRVSTTAYTIMNLLESPLRDRQAMRDLAGAGVRWVSSQQRADGSWSPETPPFGGEGEIVHSAYFTAVALRCMLAYADATLDNAIGLVQASHARARTGSLMAEILKHQAAGRQYLTSSRRWRAAAVVIMTAVVVGAILTAGYEFRMALLSNWGGVTGLAIVVVAAVAVLIFDLLHYSSVLARWIRSRLGI